MNECTDSGTPVKTPGVHRVRVDSSNRTRPAWLPPAGTYAARPAGKDWDVVQVDGACAWAVLAHLHELAPDATGPVLCETSGLGRRMRLSFLVPPGTALTWNAPHTTALGTACVLTIPGDLGHDQPDGLHWVSPPGEGPQHVDPQLLRRAVTSQGGAS